MARARNVLWIIADQWRGDSLGLLGHPSALTPNLDQLAREGVTFRQHYGQGAPCGPARASMLTGQYVMNHRVVANGVPLDARHPTLPLELRRAGVDPSLVGYTTTTLDPRQVSPTDPAFREIGDVMPGWRVVAHYDEVEYRNYFAWVASRGHALPDRPTDLWRASDGVDGPTAHPNRVPAPLSDTAWAGEHAIEFLRSTRPNRPWLLHLGFYRPHPPFAAPAPWHEAVPMQCLTPALRGPIEDEAAQHPAMRHFLSTQKRSAFFEGADGLITPLSDQDIALTRRAYYGLLAEVDHWIGQVLAELKRSGQWDNTLVIFTSDHAEQLGDHHLLGKLGWFDQSYHLPLIIRAPDGVTGRTVDAMTEAVDLMPTILDSLGLPVPESCDGVSLAPWLGGATPDPWRDAVHFEFDLKGGWPRAAAPPLGLPFDASGLCTMRTRDWKYVHFGALPPALYDLRNDPGEMRNVAADPAHAGLLTTAMGRMLDWRMRHTDRTLTRFCATPDGLRDRLAPQQI